MKLREIFDLDITRDIPPVVYFHEQTPEKIADEVREYIITGGWPDDHPNKRRVPDGIHEQYVRLLTSIASELDKKGGTDLPNAWISGFYGSGKSSFAKLLGLALDGKALPDGSSVAEGLLKRDTSPRADELRKAWAALRAKVDPMAVVFDVGGKARDSEHVHAVIARMVQERLGYSRDPLTADFELRLEREGEWKRFLETAQKVLGKPWSEVRTSAFADDDFSHVLHTMFPDRYPEKLSWINSRAGTHANTGSPEDVVAAVRDMLDFRARDKTLFVVVDEVSQYVLGNHDRLDRLRAFATALGAGLKGRVWFIALGQQKLDDEAEHQASLGWVKDRFPPRLRVHLSVTNIRDVVHKRLLAKKPAHEGALRAAFEKHRADLKLFAWGCEGITADDFVEVYPLLPGHIDLLLQITTALRHRSTRAQGDDQAIRGLLQMLGELFRDRTLSDGDVGTLITFDRIYEVQHTALDADAQASMGRIHDQCAGDASGLLVRVAKAVALMELVQETIPTTPRTVAQVLYDRLDRGDNLAEVKGALEELARRNLLGYSEREGYKLQSSSGEEWERERREMPAATDQRLEVIQDHLRTALGDLEKPKLGTRGFPIVGVFTDERRGAVTLTDTRDDATVKFDFRMVRADERADAGWITRSAESAYTDTILWVAGANEELWEKAAQLVRSKAMLKRYEDRSSSLTAARKLLLQSERNRRDELVEQVKALVGTTWLQGRLYFRGEALDPKVFGNSFKTAVAGAAARKLPDLYHRFVDVVLMPAELMQLVEHELNAPSPKYLEGKLGILELDAGRYVPTCAGAVPQRILEAITADGGISGTALLATFCGPPYGFHDSIVRGCVAGLLRASKIKISPESGDGITAVRDAGVRDVFEKDRVFKRATFFPVADDEVGYQARARICAFFDKQLGHTMDREDHLIADAVQARFPALSTQLRGVVGRHQRLPGRRPVPETLTKLEAALEACLRQVRQTQPTVQAVKKHLDVLRDGVQLLRMMDSELTDDVVRELVQLDGVHAHQGEQLRELGADGSAVTPVSQPVLTALGVVEEHLRRERPWTDLQPAKEAAAVVVAAYGEVRAGLLSREEVLAQEARGRVKLHEGFATLSADESHEVLRPIAEAMTDTSREAISPPLSRLRDGFETRLQRAEDEAIARLDEIVSKKRGGQVQVVKLELNLKHREVATEAEVDALLADLRSRLMAQLKPGIRVRLG